MIIKKSIDKILVVLVILSVLVIMCYGYYILTNTDTTSGTNYVSGQTALEIENASDLSPEEKEKYTRDSLFEVNIYSNSKSNGIEIEELCINWFTDYEIENKDKYRTTGMQYIGNYVKTWQSVTTEEGQRRVSEDFTYYDTVDNITYNGYYGLAGSTATKLNRETKLVVRIGDKPYQMQLTGEVRKSELLLGFLWPVDTIYLQSYSSLFYAIMSSVKSNSQGYGDYYLSFNVTDYFTFYAFDDVTKKWTQDTVTDEINNYAKIHFHYNENGATQSDQSLFGLIECNSNWSYNPIIDTTYWQAQVIYEIGNDKLSFRESVNNDCYYVYISTELRTLINSMPRKKIIINIDTDYDNKHIIGIDYSGFKDIEINTIKIYGTGDFRLCRHSLIGTKLQSLQIQSGIMLLRDIDYKDSNLIFEEVGV